MDALTKLLGTHGPSRSSRLGDLLRDDYGATPEAIRKRLSRARPPIRSFPIPLLPKREAFLYLEEDRKNERFWINFHKALRETESIYGAALDGLIARGGIIAASEFAVISGAPLKQLRQVPAALVLSRLEEAGAIRSYGDADLGDVVKIERWELGTVDPNAWARDLTERIMLDGVREWARKLGLASYNSIAIRGDTHPRMVGPFKWDLTGPSYLLPLRGSKAGGEEQGFLVADVFANQLMTHDQIKYFIRKTTAIRATTKVGRLLPVLVAQGFTGEALTLGHKVGIVMATPSTLFGPRVGANIAELLATLTNAAAIVAGNPSRLVGLIDNLAEIEGAAGNLRGVLFELMVAFLVRGGGSIDLGRKAYDPDTGKYADIDVLLVKGKTECVAYECKGKGPGGKVTKDEVEEWLRRIPVFRGYLAAQPFLDDPKLHFELWTTGEFEPDALAKLEYEKPKRTLATIDWKDGKQVRELSKSAKEKAVTDAFDQHFFKHPLAG